MKIKVSIVVPVYKVEKYLSRCVESLLSQTLREIEIILVDDGSPDRSGEIIDAFAAADPRVRAVHQKNQGYSAAVNAGLRLARGEYVGIIESDDWVEPEMYRLLYEKAVRFKADIVKGGFSRTVSGRDTYYTAPTVDLREAPTNVFSLSEWPDLLAFHASLWSAIYRRELILQVMMPESAGASYQDLPFVMSIYPRARKIAVVPEGLVHWRNDPDQEHSTAENGEKLLLMLANTERALAEVSAHYEISGQEKSKAVVNAGDASNFAGAPVENSREAAKMAVLEDGASPGKAHEAKYLGVLEAAYVQAFWVNIGFFFKIKKRYRAEYYQGLRRLFGDVNFLTARWLRPEDLRLLKMIQQDKGPVALWRAYALSALLRRLRKIP